MPHRKIRCKLHRRRPFRQVEHHRAILITRDMVLVQKAESRILCQMCSLAYAISATSLFSFTSSFNTVSLFIRDLSYLNYLENHINDSTNVIIPAIINGIEIKYPIILALLSAIGSM